ncbi:MAG: ribonuclease P protein component [Halothiobacillus sp. 24-54-40]|nr:MAG: ribonuclease P protein component [Halothiobacillus sp. 35-54-62]OYZ85689.1 MAG: ribonuclease P protein component [Halothiobacillus sp. 24-54-40]OZA78912.1 MAG: ribonuclease P protein component [Halothiobacillus sp. 39-53-45]
MRAARKAASVSPFNLGSPTGRPLHRAMLAPPKRFGFSIEARLIRPDEFKLVLSSGKRIHHDQLMAVVSSFAGDAPRLGLAIAKRQARLAHDRNRIKRTAREYFRLHRAQLPVLDYVVMAKSGADKLPPAALNLMMHQLFEKVAARCAGS